MCGLSGGVCVARGGVGAEPRLAHRADERSSACGGVHASTPPRCLPVCVVWLGVLGVLRPAAMCGLSGGVGAPPGGTRAEPALAQRVTGAPRPGGGLSP